MKRIALSMLVLAAMLGTPQVLACDQHGTADNYFLAYIDFRDMTEAEQRAAEQRAIDQFHAQQLQAAKASFRRRFTPDPVPDRALDAGSAQPTL